MYTIAMDQTAQKKFSLIARAKSANHAFRGIGIMIRSQHNAWVHIAIAILVIVLGFFFSITFAEWMMLIFAITIVIAAEAFNTALEIDIDLTSPTPHPFARDTKDVAAGAVLISVLGAVIIGLSIFVPYFSRLIA